MFLHILANTCYYLSFYYSHPPGRVISWFWFAFFLIMLAIFSCAYCPLFSLWEQMILEKCLLIFGRVLDKVLNPLSYIPQKPARF
jgi:hypothetical protein